MWWYCWRHTRLGVGTPWRDQRRNGVATKPPAHSKTSTRYESASTSGVPPTTPPARTPTARAATRLAAARAGLIDVSLVYRADRFSQNLSDMVTLLDELEECGVVLRSAAEPFDTATPMGRMLVQILGLFARFERDTIIDRVINGMERIHADAKTRCHPRAYQLLPHPMQS
ncbi:recombinase family protein [Prauserella marina]|nr:recombinase family protein [Prauserella marina]